ncbi:hypothetical protein F4802DRAFT_539392 [Xylaria palmicola]|nr:hypothetical protein F4802DRAFT_539392 [Xylaria palmicola]
MGQNTAASQRVVQQKESGAIDMRPESSPYASPLITIHFVDGPPLAIPIRFIDKSPKLSSCCGYNITLHLAHIPSSASHVLIHYLFTSTYECLKPRRSSCYKKNAAEFATGTQVYAVAQNYGLPNLESLTKGE